ncbi:Wiskott-Aldrich syndrome-like protein binding protein Lsb1 [Schizosaccharomyces osmophilus]|uniref:Wiskott-Aldrich syndrome-like protein binding protein Lsb1 n=1 Tax=Schizosaccharomyces osmophilus TaxID=2545709 RepID=A0AAF0AUU9_9SCHI|nr:Wiskott-Aldrich syndrome-like protein binding protein Lsb1 [Schizosaccharomyces osmophilus]WBW71733.1 Wiskott-Aldrich syndrome-like protein binding protein Lsb1 [Schizosaccharomyces osmophilus]
MIGRNPENYIKHVIRNVYNDFQLLIDEGVLDNDALHWLQQKLPSEGNGVVTPTTKARKADVQASSDSASEPQTSFVTSKVASLSVNQNEEKTPMDQSPSNVSGPQPSPSNPDKASAEQLSAEAHLPPPPSYPHAVENSTIERVVALYNFPGPDAGDLPFNTGDVIDVKEHINKDWWRGSLHGREGIFPSNYVSFLQDPSTRPPAQYPSPGSSSFAPGYPQGYGGQQQPVVVAQNPSPKKNNGLKKFGSNVGSAFVFGAGATAGADLVNSIF